MAIRITEDGVVNYENSPDVNRKLFPNLNICGKEIAELEDEINGKAPAVFSTASGSIASFDDGADDMALKSCIVSFSPIQEGSGDTSPENIRPISGRTGLSVVRYGKNLLDDSIKFVTTTGTSLYIGNNSTDYYLYLPSGTYNFSCVFASNVRYAVYIKEENGPEITIWNKASGLTSKSFVLDGGHYRISFYNPAEDGGVSADSVSNIMLNVGNSALSYEPYKGETYSVDWEAEAGTVYYGTLDVISGKLSIDGVLKTFIGAAGESWTYSGGSHPYFYCKLGGLNTGINSEVVCDTFPNNGAISTANDTEGVYVLNSTAFNSFMLYLRWYALGYSTVTDFRNWLSTNNVTIAYKLAEPTEIQLTGQEIRTLLGENNIWSDAGSISVGYPADTKTYIGAFSIKTVEVSGQTPTITAEENTRYICGEVSSLTFTPCETGICDVRFTAASISTVLTLPETVKLPDWFDPTLLEANTTYEINIVDGVYGVVMSWA